MVFGQVGSKDPGQHSDFLRELNGFFCPGPIIFINSGITLKESNPHGYRIKTIFLSEDKILHPSTRRCESVKGTKIGSYYNDQEERLSEFAKKGSTDQFLIVFSCFIINEDKGGRIHHWIQ